MTLGIAFLLALLAIPPSGVEGQRAICPCVEFQDPPDPLVEEFRDLIEAARVARKEGEDEGAKVLLKAADENFRAALDRAREDLERGGDAADRASLKRVHAMLQVMLGMGGGLSGLDEGEEAAGFLRRLVTLAAAREEEKVKAHDEAKRQVSDKLKEIGAPRGLRSVLPQEGPSEDENGASHYEKAYAAADKAVRLRPDLTSFSKICSGLKPEALSRAAEQFLKDTEPIITSVRQAQGKKGVWFKYDLDTGLGPKLALTGPERVGALLRNYVSVHVATGAEKNALEGCRMLIRFARDLPVEPGLLAAAIFLLDSKSIMGAFEDLILMRVSEDALKDLSKELDALDPVAVFQLSFTVMACQRVLGIESVLPSLAESPVPIELSTICLEDLKEPLDILIEAKRLCSLGYPESTKAMEVLIQRGKKLPYTARTIGSPPVSTLNYLAESKARLALCKVALAIRGFRNKQGRLPEHLAELVPDYLSSVPNDPFTLKPFSFSQKKIYSLGRNGTDDAAAPQGDDIVLYLK